MPVTPISEAPPKRGKKKPPTAGPPAPPTIPTWQTPTPFPEYSATILRKSRIRKTQFTKFAQELALFLAANLSGDWVVALQEAIRRGDKDAMKLLAQEFGIVKNDSGVTINLQNNIDARENAGIARNFDSIVRMLDERQKSVGIAEAASEDDSPIIDVQAAEE